MINFHDPSNIDSAKTHNLLCIKDVKADAGFSKDKEYRCYIQKMSGADNRYMVYESTSMKQNVAYHVFASKQEIEEHFTEILDGGNTVPI